MHTGVGWGALWLLDGAEETENCMSPSAPLLFDLRSHRTLTNVQNPALFEIFHQCGATFVVLIP